MKKTNTLKLSVAGLLMALTTILTVFTRIPISTSEAYIHAGDSVIYVAAYILGGPWGAVAAGIGSGLADLLLGATIYIPATLIIKACMALICAAIFTKLENRNFILRYGVGCTLAGIVMVAGYFIYGSILYGMNAAIVYVPFDCIQLVVGVAVALPVIRAARGFKSKL